MSRIDLAAARREATFVTLLEGRTATVSTLPALIRTTVGRYGTRGCAEIVATEYGDRPEVAVRRMVRARSLPKSTLHRTVGESTAWAWCGGRPPVLVERPVRSPGGRPGGRAVRSAARAGASPTARRLRADARGGAPVRAARVGGGVRGPAARHPVQRGAARG